MHPASAHALDDGVKWHVNFKHVIKLHLSLAHGVSLGNSARKTVKQKALAAIGLGNSLFDQANDDVVTDQAAAVHDLFGGHAQRCAGFDRRAQHVARGDLRNAKRLADGLRLSALTRARGS